jgi:hypothetical protein
VEGKLIPTKVRYSSVVNPSIPGPDFYRIVILFLKAKTWPTLDKKKQEKRRRKKTLASIDSIPSLKK